VAVEPDHLIGLACERPEQHRVDEREHRGVRTNAEREHGDSD
jgi:hypothetical protein